MQLDVIISTVHSYVDLYASHYSSGETKTTATWIREFVTSHPKYKRDSHVPDEIVCDLMSRIKEISEGRVSCEELIGRPNKQPC